MMGCAPNAAVAPIASIEDDGAAPMELDQPEEKGGELVVAASPESRQQRLVAWIRSVTDKPPVAAIFRARKQKVAGVVSRALSLPESVQKMQEVVLDGASSIRCTSAELYERLLTFHELASNMPSKSASQWAHFTSFDARYLDPMQLLALFQEHSHLALESGQGTGKTELILLVMTVFRILFPKFRFLFISNRVTYANTLKERCDKHDDTYKDTGVALGVRSYTEDVFRVKKVKARAGEGEDDRQTRESVNESATNQANRRLVAAPCLIISPQSMHRLFEATTEHGVPIVPHYDVIIPDEFMELLGIFHGSTMQDKRRTGLEQWTILMTKARHVWAADASFRDEMALPMLANLTGGKSFVKIQNTAKTLTRNYHHFPVKAQWRRKLLDLVAAGKKVFLASNTKAELESIMNDPELLALRLTMKGVHSKSTASDRRDYINSVENWLVCDLFGTTPVISHGVNFDAPHFDVAFLYASDMSTTAVQSFQQLNRVRQLADNNVHLFIDAKPHLHRHLSSDYKQLKADIDVKVRKHHGDWFRQSVSSYHDFSRGSRKFVNLAVKKAGAEQAAPPALPGAQDESHEHWYELDTKVDPISCVRELLDSAGNELYLHNQVAINLSRVHFERELLQEITSTGGVLLSVPLEEKDVAKTKEHAKAIREADQARKEANLQAILQAPDLDEPAFEAMRLRERLHKLEVGEDDQLSKAKWKLAYGVPLADTDRLLAIPEFPARFGTDKRLQQCSNLKLLSADPVPVEVTATSDPIGYLVKDSVAREHVAHLLESVGFQGGVGALWSDEIVEASAQIDKLEPGSDHRKQAVRRWEAAGVQGWWCSWKEKHNWKVENAEISTLDGEPVGSKVLFKAFMTGCRQYLDSHVGVKIATGRLGRSAGRGYIHQIDRTYWNDVVQGALQHSIQELDARMAAPKQRCSHDSDESAAASVDFLEE
jgi:hypothetical protein